MSIEVPTHPSMAGLPSPWRFVDEWYDFRTNPRETPGITILATVDETSYAGGSSGSDHPMIWCHERLGGRAFYSGIGHVADAWTESSFATMMDNASKWVIRRD
jgi:type 1 glutamine amidotransferase